MLHERDESLGACDFSLFFQKTPPDLIDNGLYKEIALAMETGSHRRVSVKLVAKKLGAEMVLKERRTSWTTLPIPLVPIPLVPSSIITLRRVKKPQISTACKLPSNEGHR